nr:hypothetical protein [Micromonospora sp. DSM 115978]
MSSHGPVVPGWDCAGCGMPWPCATRRQELRAEYERAPVSLSLYLSSHLVRAMSDLAGTDAGVLHRRFVGWLDQHGTPQRAPRFRRRSI